MDMEYTDGLTVHNLKVYTRMILSMVLGSLQLQMVKYFKANGCMVRDKVKALLLTRINSIYMSGKIIKPLHKRKGTEIFFEIQNND